MTNDPVSPAPRFSAQPTPSPSPAPTPRRALGLHWLAIIGLALLGVPRVILHDLALVHEQTFVNLVLVVAPLAIWVLVAVVRRVPHPFLTLLVVGAVYGVLLVITHQVLWGVAFADAPPQLGGNLATLSPEAQALITRGFAAVSGLFTGLVVGAISGLIAWGLSALARSGRSGAASN